MLRQCCGNPPHYSPLLPEPIRSAPLLPNSASTRSHQDKHKENLLQYNPTVLMRLLRKVLNFLKEWQRNTIRLIKQ